MVGSPPASLGDIGGLVSVPGSGGSPEVGMATHSGVFTWRIPWRGKRVAVQGVAGSWKGLKRLSLHTCKIHLFKSYLLEPQNVTLLGNSAVEGGI